jgi:hypothetical protein
MFLCESGKSGAARTKCGLCAPIQGIETIRVFRRHLKRFRCLSGSIEKCGEHTLRSVHVQVCKRIKHMRVKLGTQPGELALGKLACRENRPIA